MVIHQHLAHQRILYEELLKNITVHQGVSQQLLFPLELPFSIPDMQVLQKIQEQLERYWLCFWCLWRGHFVYNRYSCSFGGGAKPVWF